jgi:hypothetical protein
MAKLTRKEKRKLRERVRRWVSGKIRSSEFPADWFEDLDNDQNALAYIEEFKGQLADGMITANINEVDTTES